LTLTQLTRPPWSDRTPAGSCTLAGLSTRQRPGSGCPFPKRDSSAPKPERVPAPVTATRGSVKPSAMEAGRFRPTAHTGMDDLRSAAPRDPPGQHPLPVRDLALRVDRKRMRSNCRCDVSTLAGSWKFMHGCAYMHAYTTPSIRQKRAVRRQHERQKTWPPSPPASNARSSPQAWCLPGCGGSDYRPVTQVQPCRRVMLDTTRPSSDSVTA
jgi:hypothetical protein